MNHASPDSLTVSLPPAAVLARHGKSFYWASFFLGKDLADRAAQLYQFCRYVDDLADGDLPDRKESLNNIRARLQGSGHPAGPEIEAFIQLANDCDIPLSAARELLDGMLADQQPTALSDTTELLRYCHANDPYRKRCAGRRTNGTPLLTHLLGRFTRYCHRRSR